jgi:hypothetical protein
MSARREPKAADIGMQREQLRAARTPENALQHIFRPAMALGHLFELGGIRIVSFLNADLNAAVSEAGAA